MQLLKALALKYLPNAVLRPLKRYHYARTVAAAKLADELEFAVIGRIVRPGDCVVDVGAHVGIYTKLLSQLVGNAGLVVAFEPLPSTYEILANNIAQLGLSNVRAFNLAVSDSCGSAQMRVTRYLQNADGSYFARIVSGHASPRAGIVQVETTTLDRALKDIARPVRFVKIDVEGHELMCIRGGLRVVDDSKPALLIEVLSDPDIAGSSAHTLFELLRGLEYKPFWYDGDVLRTRREGDRSVNYFFLRSEHLGALETLL
jgi:FkbM family methyltransferase